ncbi:FkbM family methyltransferase [Aestuariicoccus sp. MJ-SS9]|uniref:FkbM family methyltransferase n=1 Tax=Aestuariicoccus sp. MJ-SS9 TaxID=3079855 RepID=UPI00290DBD76|nr:FkbM family methyltransferase [Aestuariicoccus sp. MJ-SS9]MDU8911943.1 FkbM family methyltransferase [Aestuariicoccus sp. MJ-SS9]
MPDSPAVLRARLALWQLADRIKPARRASKRRAAALAQLEGEAYLRAANAAARGIRGTHPTFARDGDSGLFECHDGAQVHCFAHRPRVSYYLSGLARRGQQLAGEYLLEHVDFGTDPRIVDIGANVGDLALALQARGVTASLTSFEPSPMEFAALERNLAANPAVTGHDARNAAAWKDATEAMTFYLKSGSADSSLLPIEGYDTKIDVPTVRLDDALPRDADYTLLKLEAEGAEPEILEGASQVIRQFRFVAADVGFERGMKHESTLPEVTEFMLDHGFGIRAVGRQRLVLLFERKEGRA